MQVPFSEHPGRHERHFRRKLHNALFNDPLDGYSDEQLLEVQRLDHEELIGFLGELREHVQLAVDLKPNEESQVVLDLKERLDKLYEKASGLADDQSGNKSALRQLIAVIMKTVRAQAQGDALAASELEQEEEARTLHFSLLEQPLVADLLHPESLIGSSELVPTLLSEHEDAVASALELFDAQQLTVIHAQAAQLLGARDLERSRTIEARARLRQVVERLQALGVELDMRSETG